MDHRFAEQTHAVEKYLLNELTEKEKAAFEEHFFDCPICADVLKHDSISIANLKQALREEKPGLATQRQASQDLSRRRPWFAWPQPASWIPALAALALAAVVTYQNVVSIPALEKPRAFASTEVIAPVSRGGGHVNRIDRRNPMFALSFEVDQPQAYPSYICDFQAEMGKPILTVDSGKQNVAAFTLNLLLPSKRFPAGRYVMILHPEPEQQAEVRYPFVIEDEDFR